MTFVSARFDMNFIMVVLTFHQLTVIAPSYPSRKPVEPKINDGCRIEGQYLADEQPAHN